MAKKTKNNTLTVKQSNKLGTDLTNIMSGLQALRHETDKFLETVFDMAEIYSNELDRVAFYLLECDNPEELRAYEAEEKGE